MSKKRFEQEIISIADQVPELRSKIWAFYWALPIFLLLPLSLVFWLWTASHLYIYIGYGLYLLYTLIRYWQAKRSFHQDFKPGEAMRYQGKIVNVQLVNKKSFVRRIKQVIVSIGQASETKDFILYQNRRRPFITDDRSLLLRQNELTLFHLDITVLPLSNKLLAYKLTDKQQEDLPVWNDSELTVLTSKVLMRDPHFKTHKLTKDRIDFIHFKRAVENGHFILQMSSDSDPEMLEVPSFLPNFAQLEAWMYQLPDFEVAKYESEKGNPDVIPRFLLWERLYKVGVSHHSVYAGMEFYQSNDCLHIRMNNGDHAEILKKEAQIISIKSYAESHPEADYELTFHGFTVASMTVKSRAENFKELLQWMKGLPDFDAAFFEKQLPALTEKPIVLWLAPPNTTAQLITTETSNPNFLQDLEKGIFLENYQVILNWSDYQTLEQNRLAKKQRMPSPNPNYHFYTYSIEKPQILQGLQLEKLDFTTAAITNDDILNSRWPMENASANLSFGLPGADNYHQLKAHLTSVFGVAPELHEQSGFLEARWSTGRLTVTVKGWSPHEIEPYFNSCSLHFDYNPDVSSFFEDAYVQDFRLDRHIVFQLFDAPLSIFADYKSNAFTRRTPKEFSHQLKDDQFVIWLDQQENLVGIGNKGFAHIQSLKKHKGWLLVGNFWRDHATDLGLYFHEGEYTNRTGPDNSIGEFRIAEEPHWAAIIKQMEAFVPFDCHYAENRQYY